MVQVAGPVPQDPSQFSGGLPVERRVSHIDFEDELHALILSRSRWNPRYSQPE